MSQSSVEKAIEKMRTPPQRAIALSKTEWSSLEFNCKGNQLLATAPGVALVLDGYEGTVLHAFCGDGTPTSSPVTACFTPDDETVLCGNEDGTVGCWSAKTGALVKKLEGHKDRVGCIASNPKFAQFASACSNTALWLW